MDGKRPIAHDEDQAARTHAIGGLILVLAVLLIAPATASAQPVEDASFTSVISSRVDHLIGFTPTTFGIHPIGEQVVPIKVCAQIRRQLNNAAMANAGIGMLRGVAAADPLISTSLSRTRYGASNVLGAAQQNGMLTVYVY